MQTNQQVTTRPRPQSPIVVMAEKYHVEPDKLLGILRNTVIRATDKHTPTNEEIAAFIIVANQYGLSPFTRQIHAFYSEKSGIVPIVGVDGWAHVINSSDGFDGCKFVVDEEEIQDEHGTVRKMPVSATCVMYVKGRTHPVEVTEWFSECARNTIPWKTMPRRMLRHKAFMQAARLCFGLSGIYDEDEGSDILRNAKAILESAGEVSKPPEGRQRLPRRTRQVSEPEQPAPKPKVSPEVTTRECEPGEDDDELIPPGAIVDDQEPKPPPPPPPENSQWFDSLVATYDERIDSMFNTAELPSILEQLQKDAEQLGQAEYYRLTLKARDRAQRLAARQEKKS